MLAIFVNVPPELLDFLLVANLALATVILLTTFFVKSPLEFSVFPTVLLAATLGRLALNIASTRLILLGGETLQADAGGQLIRRFGEFVAGNHLVVGMLIFLILVSVQFLVITNGATRISTEPAVMGARSCNSYPQVGSQKLACRPRSDQSQRRRA